MDQQVKVIEAPKPFVSWEDMKTHGKIEEESEKSYVETLVNGATTWLDGPTGWLGRSLGVQILEFSSSSWPCNVDDLPYGPVIEVISAEYIDANGDSHSIVTEDLTDFSDMPDVRGDEGDVKIRYRAGYGVQDGEDQAKWNNVVPSPIQVAVMMLATQWYQNREGVSVGSSVDELPFAVKALIQPFRIYR